MVKEKVVKTDRELLESIDERVAMMAERIEELTISNNELAEKVANISTPGTDYEVGSYND